MTGSLGGLAAKASVVPSSYRADVEPILTEYCFDCHADGMNKGGVSFDEFDPDEDPADSRDLWQRALKNLRAGTMPPKKKDQPTKEEQDRIVQWIKAVPFGIDPENPDPGVVTLRRLNRVEYRNTIRDLMGVDFDAEAVFPPDDTGHGFDNMGEVLTLPPMLLEKYFLAAEAIVSEVVPVVPRVVKEHVIPGRHFVPAGRAVERRKGPLPLSYYEPASVSATFEAAYEGTYELHLDLKAIERPTDDAFDYNKCLLVFTVDGEEQLRQEFSWAGGKKFRYVFDQEWKSGPHILAIDLEPLTPDAEQTRALRLQVNSVTVRGPLERTHWVEPVNYRRYFGRDVPETVEDRRRYASELLEAFATRAFRRPADTETVSRLADLAEQVYEQPGQTFEAGISQAMVAVLASPRFLFREERQQSLDDDEGYAFVDEFALASRLSYFLWSSMPDEELFRLAAAGQLRAHLTPQVNRMMADWRSEAFTRNFTGQWLRARDIETVQIEEREVLAREEQRDPELEARLDRFRQLRRKQERELSEAERSELAELRPEIRRWFKRPLRAKLDGSLRRAMRLETEMHFDYVMDENRSLLELLDCDYTFLNEQLAKHYGIEGVEGDTMRRVDLPADSPRGGLLTQGTVLAVTSNPTRTSPVKRGVFLLDNVLGAPPPPPPPNIPALEDVAKGSEHKELTLRQTLAIHREAPLCSSCHNRMDPLGLAMENFNAMGMWRDRELDEPIDSTGTLITGEEFSSISQLKSILVRDHYQEFYRTVTEKLMTYALGRGLEYYDVEAVDQIVSRIESNQGRSGALLMGVIESAPFQKTRPPEPAETTGSLPRGKLSTDGKTRS